VTNKFYNSYKALFDRVKVDLEAVDSIKRVVLGEQFKVTELPMATINPEPTDIALAALGTMLENHVTFSVIVMIRETEPTDWFADILSPMGDVMDAIIADSTLNGTVKDVNPVFFSPGEIRTQGKLYYGGVVRFSAIVLFTP
jgi:hypothetical protein